MNLQILALAALRVKQRQESQADPYAVVWLDEYLDDPTEAGNSPSGLFLPRKAESIEAWVNSPLVQALRAKLRAPGDGPC
jgi:hypothetical protein